MAITTIRVMIIAVIAAIPATGITGNSFVSVDARVGAVDDRVLGRVVGVVNTVGVDVGIDVNVELLDDVVVDAVGTVDDGGVGVDDDVVESGRPATILLTVAPTLMPKAILPPVLARKSILPFSTCEPRDLSP